MRRAADAAGRFDRTLTGVVQGAEDATLFPLVSAKLRRCTVACRAQVTGVADLLRIENAAGAQGGGAGFDVALVRLRVQRPDGEAEACVRQYVPPEARRAFGPGLEVAVRAHEAERSVAVIAFHATIVTARQYAWPDPPEWPAQGRIEVRDRGRHERRLAERRATWAPATAALVDGGTRGGYTDSRMDWKLALDLDSRRATVAERVPHLAIARLFETRVTSGRLADKVELVARAGMPVDVLVGGAGGEVAVDWEATLNRG